MKKLLLICAFMGASVNALEFGYMGNKAFGMGGSGVALSKNPFSAYYNPALLSTDSGLKFGYSFGIRAREHNIGALSDLNNNTITNFLNDNSLNITSENGLAMQIPIPIGGMFSSALGIGVFYTKMGTINFVNGTNNDRKIIINGLDLLEIPLSYAFNIFGKFGKFDVGISAKYIGAKHSLINQAFSGNDFLSNALNRAFESNSGISTNAFGVDIGLAYSLPLDTFVIGVVGKNLNAPNIKTMSNERLRLDPQYRLGLSTAAIPMTTLALDLDLKPNIEFRGLDNGMAKKKTQYISFGGEVDLTFMDIRLGIAKNLANSSEGILFSGGLGFKFIDISLFSSTNITQGGGSKIPTEFGAKIGGGFSF